jgi:NAD(P) transhydrogenase subunit alpha
MIIGISRETFPSEKRVALTPESVKSLFDKDFEVMVESGAGKFSGFSDEMYRENNARIVNKRTQVFNEADIMLQVRGAGANPEKADSDIKLMKGGQILVGLLNPFAAPSLIERIAGKRVTAFAMELIPRISKAQSMDVLSSMATIAGYKSILIAASELPKMFPLLMTAAGTIRPARVFVIGAGVAGLQAIATAKRLGAVVSAYDIRKDVKEQIESLGAKFIELKIERKEKTEEKGYAREMDAEFYEEQRKLLSKVVSENDVVITTAGVPGKKSPVLIDRYMIEKMKSGSVIVDVVAESGGNCEMTEAGRIINKDGVKIIGALNLPSLLPFNSSKLYSKNITNFIFHILKNGEIDRKDEITSSTMITFEGEITNSDLKKQL